MVDEKAGVKIKRRTELKEKEHFKGSVRGEKISTKEVFRYGIICLDMG